MLASPHSKPPRSRAEREAYARHLEELAGLREERERRRGGLLNFIPRVSPHLAAPRHLAPLATLFDRIARGERVRAIVDVPAQHGKTTTSCIHGIPYLRKRQPRWPLAYVTFSQTQAERKSFDAQFVGIACGAIDPKRDRVSLEEWRDPQGGGCLFVGIGGGLGGNPVRAMIFDDFFKNREEAESAVRRETVAGWITSVAVPRLPEDGSMIIPSTRWHEDDPIGRILRGKLCQEMGFEHVSLPFLATIDEHGQRIADDHGDSVLWPREQLPSGAWVGWTPEGARERLASVGPYDAASIYQGQPKPRGGTVYAQPVRCERPELAGAHIVIGCDPAGTDGPNSNHTVLVALAVRSVRARTIDPFSAEDAMVRVADVAGVLRLRLRAEHAAPQVYAWQRLFAGTPLNIEATRDGKDLGRALQKIEPRIVIRYVAASGDKFIRSQPPAAAWNAGRIRVPLTAAAMRGTSDADLLDFVRVVTKFAGMGDAEDDDPDALAHAWAAGAISGPTFFQR